MDNHTLAGDHASSRSTIVFAVVVAMISLSTIFVSLRFVSRAGVVKRLMLDDFFMGLAWVCSRRPLILTIYTPVDSLSPLSFLYSECPLPSATAHTTD